MDTFSLWLKANLEEQGMTSAALARKLGVSKSTISLWLKAERKPDYDSLKRIVNFFCSSKAEKVAALFFIFYSQKKG